MIPLKGSSVNIMQDGKRNLK